jgi:NifU-like protein involved in Fe-S cluster formation
MTDSLYQDAIKRCAEAGHGHGQLAAASGAAKLSNPLCGDRVRMQVALDAGRISGIAHETKGCLLCRAAASLLGERATGLDEAAIAALAGGLESLLQEGTPPPAGWPELAMFIPAQAHASRHRCILLPLRALQAALHDAGTGVGAGDTAKLAGAAPSQPNFQKE